MTSAYDHLARDARKQLEAGGASFFYDRVSLQQVDGRQPHVRLASACDEYHQALALKDHTNASRILATILGLLRLVYGPLHPRVCTCHLALTRVYLEQLNQVDIAYHHACKSKEMLRKLKAVASDSVQLQLATWAIVARTALEAGKLQEATQCIQETKTLLTSEAEGASPHIVWYIHLTAALVGEAAGDEARALDDAHVALSALEDAERSAGDASNKEGATHNDAMLRERDPLDPFSPTQLYDDMGVAWIWTLTTAGRLLAKNGDESQHVFDKALQLCEDSEDSASIMAAQCIVRCAQALMLAEKPDAARVETALAQAHQYFVTLAGAESDEALQVQEELARFHVRIAHSAARGELMHLRKIYARVYGKRSRRYGDVSKLIGLVLLSHGEVDKARKALATAEAAYTCDRDETQVLEIKNIISAITSC